MWRKDAAKCAKDATMRTKDVVMCANDAVMCTTHPRRITKECCPCAFFFDDQPLVAAAGPVCSIEGFGSRSQISKRCRHVRQERGHERQ